MKARLIGSNTIVEVNECGYQDMGGKYYDCPAHKCYYHEDRLDFNIDEDKPISVSPSLKNAAWDYSRSQPFNKPARFIEKIDKMINSLERFREHLISDSPHKPTER